MKYFDLFDEMALEGRWHLGRLLTAAGEPVNFRFGTRSDISGGLTTEITHGVRQLAFCLTSFGDPVVSEDLGAAIQRIAGEEVQLIPLEISKGIGGYVILNATKSIACVDESRSRFLKWTEKDERPDLLGSYRQITQLRVNFARIPPSTNVFRIQGWEVALVVSEDVKREMERVGCKGAKFEKLI